MGLLYQRETQWEQGFPPPFAGPSVPVCSASAMEVLGRVRLVLSRPLCGLPAAAGPSFLLVFGAILFQ